MSTQVPANRETSELTEGDRRVKFSSLAGRGEPTSKETNQHGQGVSKESQEEEKPSQLSFAGYLL